MLTYFDRCKLHAKIENNENIKKHYNLDNLEAVIKDLKEGQIKYISDLLEYKKYGKLNRLLISLGLKHKLI